MAILSTFALTLYTKATSELQMLGCINGHGFLKLYNPRKYNETQTWYFHLMLMWKTFLKYHISSRLLSSLSLYKISRIA